jgi:hypothetical protein
MKCTLLCLNCYLLSFKDDYHFTSSRTIYQLVSKYLLIEYTDFDLDEEFSSCNDLRVNSNKLLHFFLQVVFV